MDKYVKQIKLSSLVMFALVVVTYQMVTQRHSLQQSLDTATECSLLGYLAKPSSSSAARWRFDYEYPDPSGGLSVRKWQITGFVGKLTPIERLASEYASSHWTKGTLSIFAPYSATLGPKEIVHLGNPGIAASYELSTVHDQEAFDRWRGNMPADLDTRSGADFVISRGSGYYSSELLSGSKAISVPLLQGKNPSLTSQTLYDCLLDEARNSTVRAGVFTNTEAATPSDAVETISARLKLNRIKLPVIDVEIPENLAQNAVAFLMTVEIFVIYSALLQLSKADEAAKGESFLLTEQFSGLGFFDRFLIWLGKLAHTGYIGMILVAPLFAIKEMFFRDSSFLVSVNVGDGFDQRPTLIHYIFAAAYYLDLAIAARSTLLLLDVVLNARPVRATAGK